MQRLRPFAQPLGRGIAGPAGYPILLAQRARRSLYFANFELRLHWQAEAQFEICEVEAAARSLREQDRIAGRTGDTTAQWLCEWAESLHLSLHGRLDKAEARAQRAAES